MSCELTTYTTNVTDCCYLQILCNGTVVREFNLAELRVIDKGDSFTIRDRVGSMDFSNATIDVTAEDVRTLRCSCAGGAVGSCMFLNISEPPDGNIISNTAGYNFADCAEFEAYIAASLTFYLQFECLIIILNDTVGQFTWVGQVQNGVGVCITQITH